MGTFVSGNPALPALKTNATIPSSNPSELDAEDINNLWSAAGDLRTWIQTYFDSTGRLANPQIGKGGDIVSVKDWGADPTGAVDATTAFNNALADTAKIVLVPGGTYTISGAGISIPLGKSLIGSGPQVSTLSYSGTGACITLSSVQGCTVSGLKISCTNATATVNGILVTVSSATTCQWNVISNCTIRNDSSTPQASGQVGMLLDNSSSATGIYWNTFRDLSLGNWETSVKLLGGASNQPNQNHFEKIMSFAAVTGFFISRANDNTIHGLYGSASGFVSAQTLLVIGDGATASDGNQIFGLTSDQGANGKAYAIASLSVANTIIANTESSVASTDGNATSTNTNIRIEQKPGAYPTYIIGNLTFGQQVIAATPTPSSGPFVIRGAVADGASAIAVRSTGNATLNNATAVIHEFWNGARKLAIDLNGKSVYPTGGAADIVGRAVLVAGTVTVSTTAVTANSVIMLTRQVTGGTTGDLRVGTITAATSFVINSLSGTDTSTVSWVIHN